MRFAVGIKVALVTLGVWVLSACHDDRAAPTSPSPPLPVPSATYTVGGTLSGLNGSVTLGNNSGDSRTLTANGAFTFATAATSGSAYNVTVTSQPANQTCTVASGTGSIAASNVSGVAVSCVTNTFTVGGTVTGLSGAGLILQNNGADNLARAADGAFTFATAIASGGAYNVSVLTQPTSPAQTCTASMNAGNVTAGVTNVVIICITDTAAGVTNIGPAGGTVSGHYGARIIIPAGALATTVGIGLKRGSTNSPPFAVIDVDAVGATYELTPHGQSFSMPVTLRIPFDPEQLPNDAVPVLYKAETGGTFTALPTTLNGNFLEASVVGFSWVIPGYVATKPRMVYALEAAGTFSTTGLASYRIDKTTGSLSAPTSSVPTGEAPTSVVAHPSRRFVYVTNAGSTTVNGIAPNSISAYPLSTINGQVVGPTKATVATGAPIGQRPTMPVIHPSGKFLYVMNFGSVSGNAGGDISAFTIDGATGALTLSASVISGGGAQPMGLAFNSLGTFAYVLYGGSQSSNTFSSQVKVYSVDVTTGAFTGPTSGIAAGVLGSNPWSIAVDPDGKFAYVVCLSTDELRAYSIDSTTGALTFLSSVSITATSKPSALAADPLGRFLYTGRQTPFSNVNVQSYTIAPGTGTPTLANGVLTSCIGGACTGPVPVLADPQGDFVFANDVDQGLSAFRVNSTTGVLTAAGSVPNVFIPWTGGVGIPFTFGVSGTHPLWQNNCTLGCAMVRTGGGGGGGTPANPNPPTSHYLSVTQGAFMGVVTSSPAGIDYGPPGQGNVSATHFPVNANVQMCATPPAQSGPFDTTWSGSCSGTSECTSVSMNADKSCHVEFTQTSLR